MPKELFTAGYEGLDISSFIDNLKSHSINCLLDVREIPLSRKPGFSKSALAEKLQENRISYIHFKKLGSPKSIRDRLKADKNFEVFFEAMDEYLTTQGDSIEQTYQYVISHTCCIMCFEHKAEQCHRKIVAKKIKERDGNGLRVENI